MNQLFQGDNLEILHNMPGGSVDLICTDPPFNTRRNQGESYAAWEEGHKNRYSDNWKDVGIDLDFRRYSKYESKSQWRDKPCEIIPQLLLLFEQVQGKTSLGFYCFMAHRLLEMKRVLKKDGSIYLQCDKHASHYLKILMDVIFYRKAFKNEIIWNKNHTSCVIQKDAKRHQFFVITESILFYSNNLNKLEPCFNLTDEKSNLWSFSRVKSKERLGYPTQKPVALYERIIKASSNQHDIVLDPFAGSGTTLDAAHTLGRHWIGIDIGDAAIETIQERMRNRHGLEYDRDYEIIRGT